MKFDITKLPVDKMVMGMLVSVLAIAFVFAFINVEDGGGEGEAVAASPSPEGSPAPGGGLQIVAVPVNKFEQSELTVPAGEEVTVTLDNRDTGQLHNWAVYQDESAGERLFTTGICPGPCQEKVTFTVDAGEYFFRCDIHPVQMTGTLIAK